MFIKYLLSQLMTIFNVEFVKSFNVLINKCNWYDDEIFFALLYITLKNATIRF